MVSKLLVVGFSQIDPRLREDDIVDYLLVAQYISVLAELFGRKVHHVSEKAPAGHEEEFDIIQMSDLGDFS